MTAWAKRHVEGVVMLLLSAFLVILAFALSAEPVRVEAATPVPVATAEPIPDCVPVGKVGTEVLYWCENDYGPSCAWDPSPTLGAGVVDCEGD